MIGPDVTERLHLAERVLDPSGTARLVVVRQFRRDRVLRCQVEPLGGGFPSTVILKMRVRTQEWRDWDDVPLAMENDRAGLEQVARAVPGMAAQVVAADIEAGILILEDVEDADSRLLIDLLSGEDEGLARRAMIAYAGALGTRHRQTRRGSPDPDGNTRMPPGLRNSADGREAWLAGTNLTVATQRVQDVARSVGLPVPKALGEALADVVALLTDPGPFLAFSHGDICPDNVTFSHGRARFFDFERSAYHHCLLDAAYFHTPFPYCRLWRRIPDDLTVAMERAYKSALPDELATSPAYPRGAAAAATAWLVWVLEKFLVLQVSNDDPVQRRRLLDTITCHADLLSEVGAYPELQAWSTDLHSQLSQRWGIRDRSELYPAFGGAPPRRSPNDLRPVL